MTRARLATDVVSDASVAFTWFFEESEEQVPESRALIAAQDDRKLRLSVLDLTLYEVGNAALQGPRRVDAARAIEVVAALRVIARISIPTPEELDLTARLAEQHALTFYDAAYAAVAQARGAALVTLDRRLLAAGLGESPAALATRLGLTG